MQNTGYLLDFYRLPVSVFTLRLKCDGTCAETRFSLSRTNGPVHLNRPGGGGGRQFSRLPAAEVCVSAVVMLDIPCSEVVRRVLATHCSRQVPPSLPLPCVPCAITFQLDSTTSLKVKKAYILPK